MSSTDTPSLPFKLARVHAPATRVAVLRDETQALAALRDFIDAHPRLFVLTGAGISTGSGIPDYRGSDGAWKRNAPITHQQFTGDAAFRARYWRRSFAGWPMVGRAQPNAAHRALARLQTEGRLSGLTTQNVDGLHQRAGHADVVDLHGRIDRVRCMGCGIGMDRAELQPRLAAAHPHWQARAAPAPDGDAEVDEVDFARYVEPRCETCGGLWKPDVVFFGGAVPAQAVETTRTALEAADALLVVGSSLMVYSGYRFVQQAHGRGLPIALLNRGVTRADDLATHKWDADCALLAQVVRSG